MEDPLLLTNEILIFSIYCDFCDHSPCNSISDSSPAVYSFIITTKPNTTTQCYNMLIRYKNMLYTTTLYLDFSSFYVLFFYFLL